MGFLALTYPAPVLAVTKWDDPYPRIVACLDAHADEYDLKNGLADYWRARQISLLSKKDLHADQAIKGELVISPFVANLEKSYSEKKRTFVLTNTPTHTPGLIEEDVIRIHGQPDARFLCNGYPVLVYKEGLNVGIPLAEKFRLFSKRLVNKVAVLEQGGFPSDVGQWQDRSILSSGKAGWLLTGPYATLAPGSYRLQWRGGFVPDGPEEVGFVDVASGMGTNILTRIPITRKSLAVQSKGQLAVVEFSVNHDISLIEFRFFVNEKAIVRVDDLVISRF